MNKAVEANSASGVVLSTFAGAKIGHISVMQPSKTIPCATCGVPVDFSAPPVGPFCSPRCQMVDLGRWFAEDYRISEPLDYEELEELHRQQDPPYRSQD